MAIEYEKKFLVDTTKWQEYKKLNKIQAKKNNLILQGYITNDSNNAEVRIRIYKEKGYITIKNTSYSLIPVLQRGGHEFEYEIPIDDASLMFHLFIEKYIRKIRYKILGPDNLIYEVDEYLDDNLGLVTCEVELPLDYNKEVEYLPFMLSEISEINEEKYSNKNLIEYPFNKW